MRQTQTVLHGKVARKHSEIRQEAQLLLGWPTVLPQS